MTAHRTAGPATVAGRAAMVEAAMAEAAMTEAAMTAEVSA